jgi:hypothetical protein
VPPRKPYEFQDESEIAEHLQQHRDALERWFDGEIEDLSDLIRESVSSNTFRAFARLPKRPSVVFREWAFEQYRNPDELVAILRDDSQERFDSWTNVVAFRLADHWVKAMGQRMAYGATRKLTDLVVKHLILWPGLPDSARAALKQRAHAPLDKYVLVGIRSCVPWASIPREPGMSFVTTQDLYSGLQRFIRSATSRAGFSPIHFDILVWNLTHDHF